MTPVADVAVVQCFSGESVAPVAAPRTEPGDGGSSRLLTGRGWGEMGGPRWCREKGKRQGKRAHWASSTLFQGFL
jgi:hypothetical protein